MSQRIVVSITLLVTVRRNMMLTVYADGYATTTENRTEFPLSGGFYSMHSGHPDWTCKPDFVIQTAYRLTCW